MEDVFHFNFLAFFLAFMVGIMYVYVQSPPVKVVVKYPTPYNAGKTIYKDNAGTCFVLSANHMSSCPKNAKPQPIDN